MPDVWRQTAGGVSVTQDQLEEVAKELFANAQGRFVWLIFGEMGSGKTTLVKAIGKAAGVVEPMSSPTFSLVNEYQAADGKKIFHFDLYRLKHEREILDIGAEEYFNSNELCLVEWPGKLGSLTPEKVLKIRINPTDAEHRKIEYQQA